MGSQQPLLSTEENHFGTWEILSIWYHSKGAAVSFSTENIDFLLKTILTKRDKFCSVLCSVFMKRWFFWKNVLTNFGADVVLLAPVVGKFLEVRVVVPFKKLQKATLDFFLCRWRMQKMQMLNHIEIKCRNINVNFKANLIASRKLFYIDRSSNMTDHLLG